MTDPAIHEALGGVLEADETYVGGKPHRFGDNRLGEIRLSERLNKDSGCRTRAAGGKISHKSVANVNQKNLKLFIGLNADLNSIVNTDQSGVYPKFARFKRHDVVNHSQLNMPAKF